MQKKLFFLGGPRDILLKSKRKRDFLNLYDDFVCFLSLYRQITGEITFLMFFEKCVFALKSSFQL